MSELLSKEQFAEIEHRKPYQYGTMVRLTVAERDALCAQLHEVEAERSHYREALNAIAIKKYDNWAFGEVVGLAKRTIESLPERQTWCDHCSADLNGVKHILCDKDYQLFAKALYDVEKFRERAIEAVRAHVSKYDDHYMHCLTECVPELLQSLPAISKEVGHATHDSKS